MDEDDRVNIPDTLLDDRPFSAIVKISALFPNGAIYSGTGAMIGPDDVLTVAHLLYSHDSGGWATDVIVTPGYGPDKSDFGTVIAENYAVTSEWVESPDFNHDYATLDLGENIGFKTGWFDFMAIGEQGAFVESLGYPFDRGGDQMVYSSGTIDSEVENTFQFYDDLDALPGQSGSPVLLKNSETQELAIVGMVSWEIVNYSQKINGVNRLTSQAMERITKYIGEPELEFQPPQDITGFDEIFYLNLNPDVADAVADGWMPDGQSHYDIYGWKESRDPCPEFNTDFYLKKNPDVDTAGINPFQHYLEYGREEGRVPDFDPDFYLEAYQDVTDAGIDPYDHYYTAGQYEGRMPVRPGTESDYLITSAQLNPNHALLSSYTTSSDQSVTNDEAGADTLFSECAESVDVPLLGVACDQLTMNGDVTGGVFLV